MLKFKDTKMITVQDWDNLVSKTYNKPYSFQQQDGCQPRGIVHIIIPDEDIHQETNKSIPEVINGEEMCVNFDVWLKRDPEAPLNPSKEELEECNYYWGKTEAEELEWKKDKSNISMFYERNFYPPLQSVANDLHEKGLIEAGEYAIEIDW